MNEITPALVYWITRLEIIKFLGTGMAVIGIFVGMLLFGPLSDDCFNESDKAAMRKAQKLLLRAGTIGLLLMSFVPTKKEMAAILVVPRIANSETMEQLGDGVKIALEWMEELRPNKKDNK